MQSLLEDEIVFLNDFCWQNDVNDDVYNPTLATKYISKQNTFQLSIYSIILSTNHIQQILQSSSHYYQIVLNWQPGYSAE